MSIFQATEGAVHEAGRKHVPQDDVLASLVSGNHRPHPRHEVYFNRKLHEGIGTVEEKVPTEAMKLGIE